MIETLKRYSPLPLRLMVGLGFVSHAVPRLFTVEGHAGLAAALRQLGVPFPSMAAWFTSTFEFLGGLAVLEGVLFPVAVSLLLADLLMALVATFLHGGVSLLLATRAASGPDLGLPGVHVNLLYGAALLSLLLGGPGPLSVAALSRRRDRLGPSIPATAQVART